MEEERVRQLLFAARLAHLPLGFLRMFEGIVPDEIIALSLLGDEFRYPLAPKGREVLL